MDFCFVPPKFKSAILLTVNSSAFFYLLTHPVKSSLFLLCKSHRGENSLVVTPVEGEGSLPHA